MEVNWSELLACRGAASAREVPSAVEVLFKGSPIERKQAYWKIDNYVVVQGGLFESAAYTARLIVDKAKANPEELNAEILNLLFELANGCTHELVGHGPLQGKPIQKLCHETVAELIPLLASKQADFGYRERKTIQDILEAFA